MDFIDLIHYCKAQALRDVLSPTEESVHLSLCMAYSEKFHVALPEAMKMDPEHVLRVVFASQLESVNIEKNIDSILEQIYTLENPDYEKKKEDDLQSFIAQAEADEAVRLKKLKKTSKKKKPEPEKKPLGGSVDFSSLKNEEG